NDFVAADVSLTNGTITSGSFSADPNGQDGKDYIFTVDPTDQGTVVVNLVAGVAHDAAGNGNTAATQLTRVFDTVDPTVTISSTTNPATNVSPIPVTVSFSEPVTGFDGTAVTITGGTLTPGSFKAGGNGKDYSFTVTPTGQGTVTVDVAAGVASDAAGNPN